jgi:thiol-disulfide isomerase/thioredoxin
MKIISYFIIFISTFAKGQTTTKIKFLLEGQVANYDTGYIYFVNYDNHDVRHLDSVKVTKGLFKYTTQLNGYQDRFFIKLNPNNTNNNDSLNNVRVPIENANMSISLEIGQFSKYKLNGCRSCEVVKNYDSLNKARYDLRQVHEVILEDSTTSNIEKRKIEIKDSIERINHFSKWLNYCKLNLAKNETPYILYRILNENTLLEVKKLYTRIYRFQNNSYYGDLLGKEIKKFENYIYTEKMSAVKLLGKPAKSFIADTYEGEKVNSKEFYQSGYTILDFWASWCIPCRKSHPTFSKLVNKYRKSGLKVIGISADSDEQEWKNAITKDSIFDWPNVLNKNNQRDLLLVEKYNVNYFPTKILVNKKGTIIGIFIGEDFTQIEKKLFEVFKY